MRPNASNSGVPRIDKGRVLRLAIALLGIAALPAVSNASASPRVLRVGSFHGIAGKYKTIQAAVDAAKPGDWVLIGPGDYHERGDRARPPGEAPPAGVLILKPRLHLRGMSRNGVVVDGTKPGSSLCSRKPGAQDFGVAQDGSRIGRNGVVAYRASGVSIENLTACNFLAGSAGNGNEIWWNGGDGSGTIGMGAFKGAYLNATSTFYDGDATAASYGLFASNSRGRGLWNQTYASNFSDSGYYEGACRQECNLTMQKAWSQYSALGYSGTNSGGKIIVKESQFDHNKDGFDTNSQNNDDAPSPQDGSCPNGARSPLTHSVSCWVLLDNYIHDNNNPNVPGSGAAGSSPVGTGVSISGGRFDTLMGNRIVHNGAWGLLLVPFPDTGTPPPIAHCEGGTQTGALGFGCLYDDWGNQVFENEFSKNGFFANPTNGDIGQITFFGGNPVNCLRRNKLPDGVSPESLLTNTCGVTGSGEINQPLLEQAECNTQILSTTPCPAGSAYPRKTKTVMHALPKAKKLPTMPSPCAGVPANPWCKALKAGKKQG
jgi:hypothetical protein